MRIINFFDGAQSETTPVIGNVIAANLVQYPNDAAYEANEDGAPQTGNLYYNTTLNLIRYYNGTEWITLVDESSAQILEQKTIDADLNTITNIENENIKAGAGIDVTKLHDGSIDNTEFGYLNGVTSNIQDQLNDKQDLAEKGQPNGYASLDGAGLVPAGQLPSYVDDVLEYADLASFPVSGETGKIYVAIDTGDIYRWSGTMYVQISASGANQELSNLTPTSINQDLLPDTTATRALGSTSKAWDGVHLRTSDAANGVLIEGTSSAGSQQLLVTSNPTDVPSGATNGVHIQGRSLGEKLALATRNSTSATASSDLLLETGNNNSTGNSGSVSVRTGTVVSGTRGKFQIRDGTEGTPGYVWTSIDANGNGEWAPAAASGANTSLSNLSSVNFNTPISTDGGHSFVSGNGVNFVELGINVAGLGPAPGLGSSTSLTVAATDVLALSSLTNIAFSTPSTVDFGLTNGVNMGNKAITNLLDPTNAQDAATKNYVDSKQNKIQTKILNADVTTDGTIAALTFNNLVIGKFYSVTGNFYMFLDNGASDQDCFINIFNGATPVYLVRMRILEAADTNIDNLTLPASFTFQATATTLTCVAGSFSAAAGLFGDGSLSETHLQIEERNDLVSTTDFT